MKSKKDKSKKGKKKDKKKNVRWWERRQNSLQLEAGKERAKKQRREEMLFQKLPWPIMEEKLHKNGETFPNSRK